MNTKLVKIVLVATGKTLAAIACTAASLVISSDVAKTIANAAIEKLKN